MNEPLKIVNSQIRIPKDSWEDLKKLAQTEKRSINQELVYIVEKYIEEKKVEK